MIQSGIGLNWAEELALICETTSVQNFLRGGIHTLREMRFVVLHRRWAVERTFSW